MASWIRRFTQPNVAPITSLQDNHYDTALIKQKFGAFEDIWHVICDHCDKETLRNIRLLSRVHSEIAAQRLYKHHKVSLTRECITTLVKICDKRPHTVIRGHSWKTLLHLNPKAHRTRVQQIPRSMDLSSLLKKLSIEMTHLCVLSIDPQNPPQRAQDHLVWIRQRYMIKTRNEDFGKSNDLVFNIVFSELQNLQALVIYTKSRARGDVCCYQALRMGALTTVFFNVLKATRHLPRGLKDLTVRTGQYPRLSPGLFSRSVYQHEEMQMAVTEEERQSTFDTNIQEVLHALSNLQSLSIDIYDSELTDWPNHTWLPELLSSPLLEHLNVGFTYSQHHRCHLPPSIQRPPYRVSSRLLHLFGSGTSQLKTIRLRNVNWHSIDVGRFMITHQNTLSSVKLIDDCYCRLHTIKTTRLAFTLFGRVDLQERISFDHEDDTFREDGSSRAAIF